MWMLIVHAFYADATDLPYLILLLYNMQQKSDLCDFIDNIAIFFILFCDQIGSKNLCLRSINCKIKWIFVQKFRFKYIFAIIKDIIMQMNFYNNLKVETCVLVLSKKLNRTALKSKNNFQTSFCNFFFFFHFRSTK